MKEYQKLLRSVCHFLNFFLLMGLVTSCCMILFVRTIAESMEITLTQSNIGAAVKLTFFNVILLSLICSAIDTIRRRQMVDRPVKRIIEAVQKMMAGDFNVRIDSVHTLGEYAGLQEIAQCFNRMAEELSDTETLRTDFIANVSHELKTPLSVISNYGTMLSAPELSTEKRIEYAKAVTDSSRRLADMVSGILKLNKLENQQICLVSKSYDLGEQLCACMLGFEELWEQKELNIETDIEDGVVVCSDSEMMSLVWNNLFSNAVKFTDRGGTITLTLHSECNTAVVQIQDTGRGISREVGRRMFDKFYQGDTSHATQGNGLGLAIVKRVIDLTGSEISVESELGKGTAFTVKIERCEDACTSSPEFCKCKGETNNGQ